MLMPAATATQPVISAQPSQVSASGPGNFCAPFKAFFISHFDADSMVVSMVFSPTKSGFLPQHTPCNMLSDSSWLQRLIGVKSDKVNAILQDAYTVIYQEIKVSTYCLIYYQQVIRQGCYTFPLGNVRHGLKSKFGCHCSLFFSEILREW